MIHAMGIWDRRRPSRVCLTAVSAPPRDPGGAALAGRCVDLGGEEKNMQR
jgi:hypothetical protein